MKKKIIMILSMVLCSSITTLNAYAISLSGKDDGIMLNSFNEEYVSEYTLSEGTLSLDGQVMYVEGDFLHTGGTLNLGSGKLIVYGNYYMTDETTTGFSSGAIVMNNSEGHLLVHGDFIMSGSSDKSDFLSAGTLEIKGDFQQNDQSISNFNPSGTHTVVFSGTGEQNIYFSSPGKNYFNNLKVTNSSGRVKFNKFSINGAIIGNIVTNYDMHIYNANVILSEQTIKATKLIWHNGGTIQLGNNAKIDGNLIHAGGNLEIVGNCTVTGNYYITGETGTTLSSGKLYMKDLEGYLLINGDFKMSGNSNDSDFLNAGTLEIKGNLQQYDQSISNFNAGGTHTVVLSGDGKQTVYFANPQGNNFNILVIKNFDGVVFSTRYTYNDLQIIYPFEFKTAEYNDETNQIKVDVFVGEKLQSSNGKVLISLYDKNNKLIECRIKGLTELKPQIFDGLIEYKDSYIVKAFYWINTSSIRPLCTPINKELKTK